MPAPFQPGTLYDFLTSFGGGVNEGDSPLDIGKDVMAGAVNTTCRGKYVTHRPAYVKRRVVYANTPGQISPTQQAVEQGYFQGACFDAVDDFGNASAVALISQRLFQFSVAGNAITCVEILIPGGPILPVQPQAWLWQSECWVIVRDGLNPTIFFDLNAQTATRAIGTKALPQATAFSAAGIAANGSGTATFSSVTNLSTGAIVTTSLGQYTVGTITGFDVALTSLGTTLQWVSGSAATVYVVHWTYSVSGNYSGTAGSPAGISANGTGTAIVSDATYIGVNDVLLVAGIGNFKVTGLIGTTASLQSQTATPWPKSSFAVSWTYETGTQMSSPMRVFSPGFFKIQNAGGLIVGSALTVNGYSGTYLVTNPNPGGGGVDVALGTATAWPPNSAGYIYTVTWIQALSVSGTAYSSSGISAGESGTAVFSTATGVSQATNSIVNVTGLGQCTVESVSGIYVTLTMPTGVAWPAYNYAITWSHTGILNGSANATSSGGVPSYGTGSAIFDSTANLAVNTIISIAALGNYLVTDISGSSVSLTSQTGVAWPAAADNYDVSWAYSNSYSASAQSTGDITAGQTGTATFDSVTNLKVGAVVTVGGSAVGACQVTAINGYVVSLTNQSSNPWASGANYAVTWTNTVKQIPPGRMGAYGMGRNWVTLPDGLHFVASDIVNGASGTALYKFRDAVLYMEENTYIVGGGSFVIPANGGETIKAMRFLTTLDASLGQGPLQVFTNRRVFSCNAPVDRLTWQSITNPILTESLIHNGALGQNSTVLANSDAIFRGYDGVRSLILARQEDNTWGRSPISFEVDPRLSKDDTSLLTFGSAVVFDNRLLVTAGPVQDVQGVYFQGLVPLNFDPVSSLRGKQPSIWDAGVWTGLNILQIGVAVVDENERSFAFVLNTASGLKRIEIWEVLPSGGPLSAIADNDGVNDIPITWRFDSASLRFGVKKDDRKYMSLSNGEIWVDELQGLVTFETFYWPDQYPIPTPWRQWQVCYAAASGTSRPGFQPRMGLGEPSPQPCDPSTNRPMRNGFTFQVRVIIQGHAVFMGAFFEAQIQPMPKFAPVACGALCQIPVYVPSNLLGQLVPYTSGAPAIPGDPYLPAFAYDPNGILPSLGWNVQTQSWR